MKKRIRKKHHIGEFTEFGFEVIAPKAFATDEALDELIAFSESMGLGIGGSSIGAYVSGLGCNKGCHPRRTSCVEADRQAYINFFLRKGWRADVKGLTDAWYDWYDTGRRQPGRIHPRACRAKKR